MNTYTLKKAQMLIDGMVDEFVTLLHVAHMDLNDKYDDVPETAWATENPDSLKTGNSHIPTDYARAMARALVERILYEDSFTLEVVLPDEMPYPMEPEFKLEGVKREFNWEEEL